MKTFEIMWQNCFMEAGVYRIKTTSEIKAIQQFETVFGPDYMVVCVCS